MATPLIIPLGYSKALIAVLVFAHSVPVFGVFYSGSSLALSLGVLAVVLLSVMLYYRKSVQYAAMALLLNAEGHAFLLNAEGGCTPTELVRSQRLGQRVMVLCWTKAEDSRERFVVLTQDGLGSNSWQRLNMWLYWFPSSVL